MKNRVVAIVIFFISTTIYGQNGIVGKWKTIDSEDGEAKSIVEIYERNGKVFGKIIDILNPDDKDALCEKCEGQDKNKPVLGFELIKEMEKDGKYYKHGTIFDPEHGKKFRCRLKLTKNLNILQVRGYVAFLYATQYWERVVD